MKVIILAPIYNSLYSLLVTQGCISEPGVEVAGIIIRKILNIKRFRSEFRRDRVRLLKKMWGKLVLGHRGLSHDGGEGTPQGLARPVELRDRSLPTLARRYKIPFTKVSDLNDEHSLIFLREHSPDLVLFTGGGLIRKQILDVSGRGVLNAHMGLLPHYRGMDVVEWPFVENHHSDIEIGVTLHVMDQGVDTGPILMRRRIPIRSGDTFERIRQRFETAMIEVMLEGVRSARDHRMVLIPQNRDEGRLYFMMHPRLGDLAMKKLMAMSFGLE